MYQVINLILKFELGTLRLCDISTQKCIYAMDGHAGEVSKVSFSPQGNRILSGSTDKTSRVWNVVSGLFSIFWKFQLRVQGEQKFLEPIQKWFINKKIQKYKSNINENYKLGNQELI